MPPISDLSPLAWILLACAAVISGFSKTALPGTSTIAIALAAATLPAKASTGTMLLIFIIGDVFALLSYRRHADWPTLVRLLPAVLVGLGLGAVFLALADDGGVRRTIGVILLLVIAFTLWRRSRTASRETSRRAALAARVGYGSLGGFTTMVANAGGPAMSMYFLAARFQVLAFLGTSAWFFAVVNLVKLPIAVGLGIITWNTLALLAFLGPLVVVSALIGRRVALRMRQRTFEWIVVTGTVLGALYLIVA